MRHAPYHASLLALPFVLLLSYGAELVLIGVGAFLFFFVMLILQGLEVRANERGESLVRHGRPKRNSKHQGRPSWHVDEALSTGLECLAEGRDEADLAAMLNIRTHRGEDLGEASREHYDKAMEALREELLGSGEAMVREADDPFNASDFGSCREAVLTISSRHPLREGTARDLCTRLNGEGAVEEMLADGEVHAVRWRGETYLLPHHLMRNAR